MSNEVHKQLRYKELYSATAEGLEGAAQRLWAELLPHTYPVNNYR